jgi:hypothetical protein
MDHSGAQILDQPGLLDVKAYVRSLRAEPPKTLYHFTSVEGLIGILSERTLRLTRAVCSNDAREVRYMVDEARVAAEVLMDMDGESASLSDGARAVLSRLLARLNDDRAGWQGDRSLEHTVVFDMCLPDPYVACFCADSNPGIVHWGHYGLAGEGFALEVDSTRLPEPWKDRFIRVRYDLGDHLRAVSEIVVQQVVNEEHPGIPPCQGSAGDGASATADRMEAAIRAISVAMKDTVFEPENEWRVTWLREVDGELPIKLRGSGAELISYVEMPLPLEAIRRIVVGTKRDLRRTAGSLASYLHGQGVGHIEIVESRIPFR